MTISFQSLITPSGVKYVKIIRDGKNRKNVPANDHVDIELTETFNGKEGVFQILNAGNLGSLAFKRSNVTSPFSVNEQHLENILCDYFFCNGCTMYPPPPCTTLPPGWGTLKVRIYNEDYTYGDPLNDGCLRVSPTLLGCFTACMPGNVGEMVCLSDVSSWTALLDRFISYVQASSGGYATGTYTDFGAYADFTLYINWAQIPVPNFCQFVFEICTADCTAPTSCTARIRIDVGNVISGQSPDSCLVKIGGTCNAWTIPYTVNPGDNNFDVAASLAANLASVIPSATVNNTGITILLTVPCADIPDFWGNAPTCDALVPFDSNTPANTPFSISGNNCTGGATANILLGSGGVATVTQSGGNPQGQTINAEILEQINCTSGCA